MQHDLEGGWVNRSGLKVWTKQNGVDLLADCATNRPSVDDGPRKNIWECSQDLRAIGEQTDKMLPEEHSGPGSRRSGSSRAKQIPQHNKG